jgi:class 3 adenylate cyclase
MQEERSNAYTSTTIDVNSIDVDLDATHDLPRFPVRLRWTIFVGMAVTLAVLVLSAIVLDMEKKAWLKNQELQAGIDVSRLADELKIPMLAGSSAEVNFIIDNFAKNIPNIQAVYLENLAKQAWSVGDISNIKKELPNITLPEHTLHLSVPGLWFAKKVTYSGEEVAKVAVEYSEGAWEDLSSKLLERIWMAALLVVLLATIMVYWLASRMSKPLEELAVAAHCVAEGDYTHRLSVRGNDEFTDAATQFNHMVDELQHKEEMREVLGKYLNPELVSDVFDGESSSSLRNRKQKVTVLFADMVSFTSFSESTETEEVVDILNQYFEVFHSVIDYYGGHVDKYIGDAVMAVFNHPNKSEEHTRNAVLAGIAISIVCKKLGVVRRDGEVVSFRVGLNRGDVIIGNIGAAERLEYTVIGDAVNVASRMAGLGEANEVVVAKETFKQAGEGFEYVSMGEMVVKGVSGTLECGLVKIKDSKLIRDVDCAVSLAFDATFPTGIGISRIRNKK